MNNKKVIVIGLDGVNLDSINEWIKQGYLPNLKKIQEQASFSNLETLIPVSSGPIWASFATGKNPGKHGLLDTMQRDPNSYRRYSADSTTIKSEKIWDILTRNNKKSIIVNVPMTYPPQKLDGIMITGIMTPSDSQNYTYPPEFKEELKTVVDDYVFFPKEAFSKNNIDKYYNSLAEVTEKRAKVIKYLLKNKPWDLFVGLFDATDLIKHGILFTLDKNHPLYDEKFAKKHQDKILKIHQQVDKALGEIMELKDDDTYLIVMSDHGFGSLYNFVNVNNVLVKNGFIKFKKNIVSQLKLLMFKAGFTVKNIYTLLQKLKLISLKYKLGGGHYKTTYRLAKKMFLSLDDIDWPRTKAYSYTTFGQIFINLKGREPLGAVEKEDLPKVINEIKQALNRLKDPIDPSRPLLGVAYSKEDLYHGKYLEKAPDIIFLPRTLKNMPFSAVEFSSKKIFEKAFAVSGTHRAEGAIFYLMGPNIKLNHSADNIKITDLTPTILSLLDVPIPEDMDGKVLQNVYTDKLSFSPAQEKKSPEPKEPDQDEEDKEEVMNRLKDLGYI